MTQVEPSKDQKYHFMADMTNQAPKPAAIKDWAELSPDEKKLFARKVYGLKKALSD